MSGFAHIEVRPNGDVVLVETFAGVSGGGGGGSGSGTVDESDISVGTTQGGDDLMGLVHFSGGDFSPFTLDDGDISGSVDSFQVIDLNA